MSFLQSSLVLFVGLLFGCIAEWLFLKQKIIMEYERGVAYSQKKIGEIQEKLGAAEREITLLQNRCAEYRVELSAKTDRISELELIDSEKNVTIAQLEVKRTEESKLWESKLSFLNDTKERLKVEFQGLASKIFEEKGNLITQQNRENLEGLLNPLREQLGAFREKVETVHVRESEGRAALLNEIGHLKDLNLKISQDALNLTQALKGDNKCQGTWGELVLERVLEASGLVRGREFETQFQATGENGDRYIPDAVIFLPLGRHIIIDSKISLVAYERYCSTQDREEQEKALEDLVLSMKNHLKNLGEKRYDKLPELKSLDLVLMFVPIEAAFVAAIKHHNQLFLEALSKNIIIVCPSTMLTTLRTIAFTWRIEHQNKNAQEIAKKAGDLHDKFVQFLNIMEDVGESIKKTGERFDSAVKVLSHGKGNLIKRSEELKALGIDSKKDVPARLLELSDKSEDLEILIA